jgi:hypothetical protein
MEGADENVGEGIRHFRPPYAYVRLTPKGSVLSSDLAYDVKLDITVPATTRNVELGQSNLSL